MAPLEFSRVTLAGPLWTVDEAKAHLRVRDTAHDADITQKLATAQEAIVAYLGAAADPAWDATTAPLAVKHAVLILTTHYYEHRGDDMSPSGSGATPDADVWRALAQLLAMYRDPTLA
jgi:hypothetical protein